MAHWSDTSGALVQNWEVHENSLQSAQAKLSAVENKIEPSINYAVASIPELEAELLKLKVLNFILLSVIFHLNLH